MIDASDIGILCGIGSVGVAAVALVTTFTRNSRSDMESLRKEFTPQFENSRREIDTCKDSLRKEMEGKTETLRKDLEGKLTTLIAENKDARHQWATDFGGKLSEVANDLRRHKDGAETKAEAAERERRIMSSVSKVEQKTDSVNDTTTELRDMLTRVMVKLDVAPKPRGCD